jgi:lysophospholipase L1-like esterase
MRSAGEGSGNSLSRRQHHGAGIKKWGIRPNCLGAAQPLLSELRRHHNKQGVSGDQVGDLLARLDRNVLFDQPDWVVISIGINDVWKRMKRPTEAQANLRHYAEKLDALVARLRAKAFVWPSVRPP